MRPGTLARVLLRASLGKPEPPSGNPQVSFQHLLERLAALRETLLPADAAAAVAAGRAELDRLGEADPRTLDGRLVRNASRLGLPVRLAAS